VADNSRRKVNFIFPKRPVIKKMIKPEKYSNCNDNANK